MSGFSGEWLALREPVDDRSRSGTLVTRLSARAPEGRLRVLDLGAGTGANLRYLAPRLGGEQEWLLVDHDSSLLGLVEER
ncbi:MAG: class I SAM-dependent methyltransferase, partial [Gammaproteobacteria bacterium]|nr:class I SAM-dependent methyltransferase [Gammaproteobacteria bacterium]